MNINQVIVRHKENIILNPNDAVPTVIVLGLFFGFVSLLVSTLIFFQVTVLQDLFPLVRGEGDAGPFLRLLSLSFLAWLGSFLIPRLNEKVDLFSTDRVGGRTVLMSLVFFPCWAIFQILGIEILHRVLKGRELREKEIMEFKRVNDNLKIRLDPRGGNRLITQEFESDVDAFISKRINLTSSLKRFILERIKTDGSLNSSKIIFLRLIPKSLELPVDSVREIILANNLIKNNDFAQRRIDLIMEISDSDLDRYFIDFSPTQIKQVFTREFHFEDYVTCLIETKAIEIKENRQVKFTPAKTMGEIIDESDATRDRIKNRLKHPYLLQMKDPELVVKVLLTMRDFAVAGQSFANCVRTYANARTDVFTVSSLSGDLIACVEVDKKIVQLSGVRNGSVNPVYVKKIHEMFNRAKLK